MTVSYPARLAVEDSLVGLKKHLKETIYFNPCQNTGGLENHAKMICAEGESFLFHCQFNWKSFSNRKFEFLMNFLLDNRV